MTRSCVACVASRYYLLLVSRTPDCGGHGSHRNRLPRLPPRGRITRTDSPGYRTLLETIVFYIAGLAVATRPPGAGGGLGERSRLYIVCLAVATRPLARNFRTELVGNLHTRSSTPGRSRSAQSQRRAATSCRDRSCKPESDLGS